MERIERNLLFCILGVFIAVKIFIILFFVDTIYEYEESYIGFISNELLSGKLKLPLFDYIMESRNVSNLIPAFLLTPFIYFLGNNYIAIKIYALCTAVINLCIWYFVLRRISVRAAIIFSSIYIFTSTMLSNMILIIWPPYALISLFMGLAVLLLLKIFDSKRSKISDWALLGLVCGIGGWIYYVLLLLLPFVFFFTVIKNTNIIYKKNILIFLMFFTIGLSPWLIYNMHNNFASLSFIGGEFWQKNYYESLGNITKIFTQFFPNFFLFRGVFWEGALAYYFIFILCYGAIVFDLIKNFKIHGLQTSAQVIKFIFVGYVLMYLLIFCMVSLNKIDTKASYIVLIWPFILSIIAVGLTYVWPIFQKIILLIIFVFSVISVMYQLPYAQFLQAASYKADRNYGKLGYWLSMERNYDYSHFYQTLEGFPEEKKRNILTSYLSGMYDVEGGSLPYFLMNNYRGKLDVFCDALITTDINSSNFKKDIQNAINYCGNARHGDWQYQKLQTTNTHEVIAAIASLSNHYDQENLYYYFGRLSYLHANKLLYEYYKSIPSSFKYRYVQGYVYEEFDGFSENLFFEKNNIDNFKIIEELIQKKLSLLRMDDAEYKKDVYAAYFATSTVVLGMMIQDDYLTIPINVNKFYARIAQFKDEAMVRYVHYRITEMRQASNGYFR